MRKALIMRAFSCDKERSGVIDAAFVRVYGKETLLQRRKAYQELLAADQNGLDHSIFRDWKNIGTDNAVHDKGVLGHLNGTLALLHAVLDVRVSDVRPPAHELKTRAQIDAQANPEAAPPTPSSWSQTRKWSAASPTRRSGAATCCWRWLPR